jgi:hypothetical protein
MASREFDIGRDKPVPIIKPAKDILTTRDYFQLPLDWTTTYGAPNPEDFTVEKPKYSPRYAFNSDPLDAA